MRKPVLKLIIDSVNECYTVKGTVLDSEGELVNVGWFGFNYDRAKSEFNYYSDVNGFETQKVIIRK